MPTISFRRIIWSLLTSILLCGTAQAQANDRPPAVYFTDWSNDGSTIAIATTNLGINELTIHNADLSIRSVWQQLGQDGRRSFFGLSPNGDRILTEGAVWDTATFQPTLVAPDYYLGGWSSDGSMILAVPRSELGFVTLSSTTGQVIQSYSEGIYNMNGPVWSPDNRFFVKSDPGRMIYLFDTQTGNLIAEEQRINQLSGFAWHPDSQKFVFAEKSGEDPNVTSTIQIFDIATLEITPLITINRPINQILWSPDSNQLTVVIYDALYFVDLLSLDTKQYPMTALSSGISYSPGGGQMMLGFDFFVSGTPVTPPLGNDGYVIQALVSDGVQIFVPVATLDRFAQIAASCGAPGTLTDFDTSLTDPAAIAAQAQALLVALNALSEDTIPPGCAADLGAIAEAIIAETPLPSLFPNAGPDATYYDLNNDGSTLVQLDASASTGEISSYAWTVAGNPLATGTAPLVSLPLGFHEISLAGSNAQGQSATDSVGITVTAVPAGYQALRLQHVCMQADRSADIWRVTNPNAVPVMFWYTRGHSNDRLGTHEAPGNGSVELWANRIVPPLGGISTGASLRILVDNVIQAQATVNSFPGWTVQPPVCPQ